MHLPTTTVITVVLKLKFFIIGVILIEVAEKWGALVAHLVECVSHVSRPRVLTAATWI